MKRPVVWATAFTIYGIYGRLGMSEMICLVSFTFILIKILQYVMTEKEPRYFLFLTFALLGFLLAGRSGAALEGEMVLQGDVAGKGIVREIGETSGGNQKLTLRGDLENGLGEKAVNQKIYVIWTGKERFAVGDVVALQGELTPFYRQKYPGGYDERLYLTTRGFDCKIYPDELQKVGEVLSPALVLAKARGKLQETLDGILPAEESGIMKAMLTGEREDIPPELRELYTKAGITHILCISGLHMSMLALYVSFFVEKLLKRSRRTGAAVTMAAALGFLAFAGATPSSIRAVTMICVVMLGRLLYRTHDRLNNIAVAALGLLLVQPLYLWHIGFQLSFLTVTGLCVAAEQREKEKQGEGILAKGKDALLFSLYASLFSFPVVAYHFYWISFAGILANLVVLPLSGFLLGFGIISALLGLLFQPAGVFAAGSVYAVLRIFKAICLLLTKLPFAYVLMGRPSLFVILFYYLLLLWILTQGRKRYGYIGGAVLCALLWWGVFENQLFRKENTVAFLDVGQGDAAVVLTYDKKTYLIDGGGVYGKEFGENVGITVILPYLEYLGVEELDGVFLSHPDRDHMLGLLEVIDQIPAKALFFSDYPFACTEKLNFIKEIVEKNHIPLYTVKEGDKSSDGAWECLYPMEGVVIGDGDENHGSMVLRYAYGGMKVLFTGDIDGWDEWLLTEDGIDVAADVLKVSHHGSGYSSQDYFLKAVRPTAAVISCGQNNLYGHPHKQALERIQTVTEEIYRTDEAGSVLLRLSPRGTWHIETLAERKPFYERIKETMEKS